MIKYIGLAELLTLEPGDPRWGYSMRSLDLYQRRLPPAARNWIMQRFTLRL